MMTIDRARFIVNAINARAFATMGFAASPASLAGVSLVEMLEARAVIENINAAAEAAAKLTGAGYAVSVVPDDRLIAAYYLLDHYPCSNEPILLAPVGALHQKAVAVVRMANVPAEKTEAVE